MNPLIVDIGGSNRGFQIATEQTKRMAQDLNRQLDQYTPQTWKGAQMMRDQYGKAFNGLKGSEGIGGMVEKIKGGFGEAGEAIMHLATGPIGIAITTFVTLRDIAKESWETMRESFQLARDARTLGMTTVGLQGVQHAAEEQGVDPGEAQGRLYKLTNKVGEAAMGDKSAQNFFKDMGVEIEGKRMEEILTDITKAFEEMKDPAERAHKATQLFGRGGAEMIPVLKQMAEGVGASGITDQQTDAVLGGAWQKIHAFITGTKEMYKASGKRALENLITGYTGYQGEVDTPNKVKIQKSPEDKEAKSKAAAKHVTDMADAQKAYRKELESTGNAQTKLALQMGDERDLKQALAKAEAAHDELAALKIKTELLGKQKDIEASLKSITDAAKKKPAAQHASSSHIDSQSASGWFSSAGAVNNPVLDVSRAQLTELKGLRSDINNKPSVFSP